MKCLYQKGFIQIVIGRIMAPKDIYILIPGTREYVTYMAKGTFCM